MKLSHRAPSQRVSTHGGAAATRRRTATAACLKCSFRERTSSGSQLLATRTVVINVFACMGKVESSCNSYLLQFWNVGGKRVKKNNLIDLRCSSVYNSVEALTTSGKGYGAMPQLATGKALLNGDLPLDLMQYKDRLNIF